MITQEEIRKKLDPDGHYDIYYAVIHTNGYITYLGKNYNEALEQSSDGDEIIATTDEALYIYLHYDFIKQGLGIRIKDAEINY